MPKKILTDRRLSHRPNISGQKMTQPWGNPKRKYFPKGPKAENSQLFFYLNLKFSKGTTQSNKVTLKAPNGEIEQKNDPIENRNQTFG